MATIAQAIGLTASGLASGLVLAYPLSVNPLFLNKNESLNGSSDAQRLSIWLFGYVRGSAAIPSLAIVAATGLSLSKYWAEGVTTPYRYLASVLHVSIIPFTVLVMAGGVHRLQHLAATKGEGAQAGEVDSLLSKWATYHLVRVGLTLAGFGTAIADVLGLLA